MTASDRHEVKDADGHACATDGQHELVLMGLPRRQSREKRGRRIGFRWPPTGQD